MDPLQKLKAKLSYDPAMAILGIYSKRIENKISKRGMYTFVHCGIIHKPRRGKNLNVHQQIHRKCGLHMGWSIIQP